MSNLQEAALPRSLPLHSSWVPTQRILRDTRNLRRNSSFHTFYTGELNGCSFCVCDCSTWGLGIQRHTSGPVCAREHTRVVGPCVCERAHMCRQAPCVLSRAHVCCCNSPEPLLVFMRKVNVSMKFSWTPPRKQLNSSDHLNGQHRQEIKVKCFCLKWGSVARMLLSQVGLSLSWRFAYFGCGYQSQ